jgi:hypothetical protein
MEERLPDQPVSPIADQPSDIAWGFLGGVLCGANHLVRLHERSDTADTALSETSPDPGARLRLASLQQAPRSFLEPLIPG